MTSTRLTHRATPCTEFRADLDRRYEARGVRVYQTCTCRDRGRGWCAYWCSPPEWVAVLPSPEAAEECARLANQPEAVKA